MIYVFFAHGFEEIEAIATVDILRRAELEVRTVGVGAKTITGAHGITVHCDIIDHMVTAKELRMIVLPGGMPGTVNLEKSQEVREIIRHCVEKDIWIAAICAAPSILGHMGVLAGKKATCFPGFETQLKGANFTGSRLEQDGKLITAKGPGVTIPFALRLVELLVDKERAALLEASLQ